MCPSMSHGFGSEWPRTLISSGTPVMSVGQTSLSKTGQLCNSKIPQTS